VLNQGGMIVDGLADPQDILRLLGIEALARYIVTFGAAGRERPREHGGQDPGIVRKRAAASSRRHRSRKRPACWPKRRSWASATVCAA
jgi:hypothetical protein